MIIEKNGLLGLKSDLAHLDEASAKLGFVRWQWEYTRATYDLKLVDKTGDYFLRINTRTESGKLESPYAILYIEHIYIGRATFPHGLDYQSSVPDTILNIATQKLAQLKTELSA